MSLLGAVEGGNARDGDDQPPADGLRARSISGAVVLSLRQGAGMLIGLAGVLVMTRTLGPAGYGVYAVGLGIAVWLQTLADWGVDAYLVRLAPGVAEEGRVEAQAFTVLLVLAALGTCAALAILPLVGPLLWGGTTVAVAALLVASTPIILCAQVPISRLDRRMEYRRAATVELVSQLSLYVVAVPLVLTGGGPWAPAVGMVVSRVVLLAGAVVATSWRPRLCWDRQLAREVLGYGFGYSASITVWQLRALAVPLVVAPVAGVAVAGEVALAVRLVEIVGFVRAATWRLALAALARVQHDAARTCSAVTEGAVLQTLALGAALGSCALVAGPVLGALFGDRWRPVAQVFPLVALGAVVNGAFNLHASALYARRANWSVAAFHAVHVPVFLLVVLFSTSIWGARGYGYAEVAVLPTYGVLLLAYRRQIGPVSLGTIAPWLLAVAGVLLLQTVGPVALVLLLPPLLPAPRSAARAVVELASHILRRRRWQPA